MDSRFDFSKFEVSAIFFCDDCKRFTAAFQPEEKLTKAATSMPDVTERAATVSISGGSDGGSDGSSGGGSDGGSDGGGDAPLSGGYGISQGNPRETQKQKEPNNNNDEDHRSTQQDRITPDDNK